MIQMSGNVEIVDTGKNGKRKEIDKRLAARKKEKAKTTLTFHTQETKEMALPNTHLFEARRLSLAELQPKEKGGK
ncbi:hypothetical protein P7K49_000231 [Saguinus oedipus]|uniref:Uncharacterized protein n=1 Tax=Saguinus oedipus TaxID=9490 RepID=A0ABQ9WBN1_SAGOE|nr:hypothetical protein P7K49_000231 [Saguinus oedipus]